MNRRNWIAAALAAIVTAAAWTLTVRSAAAMAISMPMPGGWSMSMAWMAMGQQSWFDRAAMFLVMWTLMMIAMMLPSAMPAVLLHDRLMQSRREQGQPAGGSQVLLLVGYFAVWIGFGALAFLLGTAISAAAMRYVAMSRAIPAATGITLAVAGLYQLTDAKRRCLEHCRSPLYFFARQRLRGAGDSLAFGLHHGVYCAACCWGLMAMQLVLGVMSLPLMAAVATMISIEKHWRHGQAFAVVVGIVSVVAGALLVLQAVS